MTHNADTFHLGAAGTIPEVPWLVSLANTRERIPKPASGLWQLERTRLLKRICSGIAYRVQAGSTLARELRRAARRWHGRPFKAAPKQTLKLSEPTLRRAFYDWTREGDEAFRLKYKGPARKVRADVARALIAECLAAGVMSTAQAIRTVQARFRQTANRACPYSISAFYKCIPRALRPRLAALHRARMGAWKIETKARRALEGQPSLVGLRGAK